MTTVGVVTGLPLELRSLPDTGTSKQGLWAMSSGPGPERARAAALRLAEGGVGALVSWGLAGGLDPDRRAGDLILPGEVVNADGLRWRCDSEWRSELAERVERVTAVHDGAQLASSTVLIDSMAKAAAASASGAVAVDQESGAIGAVALERGLPFLVVRAICDVASVALPRAALRAVDANGQLRPLGLCGALFRRPGELVALLRLQIASRRALRTLEEFARAAGPRLGFPGPIAA